MKRKHKTKILLVVAISFLLPLLSAYIDYYVLMEADFLSADLKFENTDLEYLSLCEKQKFTVLTGFPYAFGAAGDLTGYLSRFYFPVTFPQTKILVLRC